MRRILLFFGAALLVTASLAACGKKADETVAQTGSDSLLASNPVEQPQGNMTPQTEYQPPQQQPAPAPTKAKSTSKPKTSTASHSNTPMDRTVTVNAGTTFDVTVTEKISSETAGEGSSWSGTVKEPLIVGNTVVIPAGSTVNGVVSAVRPAVHGNFAMLYLTIKSVNANGGEIPVTASTDSIIAGSTRARNVAGIAGGAAAGALIGKAVGGGGKGALIGGLIGAGAAGTAAHKAKGYQAVVKEGAVLTFTVNRKVSVRA